MRDYLQFPLCLSPRSLAALPSTRRSILGSPLLFARLCLSMKRPVWHMLNLKMVSIVIANIGWTCHSGPNCNGISQSPIKKQIRLKNKYDRRFDDVCIPSVPHPLLLVKMLSIVALIYVDLHCPIFPLHSRKQKQTFPIIGFGASFWKYLSQTHISDVIALTMIIYVFRSHPCDFLRSNLHTVILAHRETIIFVKKVDLMQRVTNAEEKGATPRKHY